MRNYLIRAGAALIMGVTAITLGGCFDLSGDSVADPTAGAPTNPTSGNTAPTISGSPPQAVKVGDNYSFTPNASDPDGDTLTFSIQNKPTWVIFDSSTGAVSGVATLGSEGTYANIQITVSDGSLSASMPQFSVNVTQVGQGSATLSWTPPTQNVDGSALTDLAAYKFYYGTEPGNYTNQVLVDNPGLSTYVIENLVPATYYFVATAINTYGAESGFSNEAVKQVL